MDKPDSGNPFDDDLSEFFDDYREPNETLLAMRYERLLISLVLTTAGTPVSRRAWIIAMRAIAYKIEQQPGVK